jgi:IS1 family transposase
MVSRCESVNGKMILYLTEQAKHFTLEGMNKLPRDKRAQILNLLCEGNSMRATSRLADVSINTVTKLLVDAGRACSDYQDQALRNLPCKRIQVDEIWAFCYSKQKNVPEAKQGEAGDIWTWVAIDADTKLVPSWFVGARDAEHARAFLADLSSRMAERIQLTSDGWAAYPDSIRDAFPYGIDYAQLVKHYGEVPGAKNEKRYSPAECVGAEKKPVSGNPDRKHISTSYVERQNLTMRMHSRGFTRLTTAFSKKAENHVYAVSLHFMFYNFCKLHKTLRVTPAMAAGVTKELWDVADIVDVLDAYEAGPIEPGPGGNSDLEPLRGDAETYVPGKLRFQNQSIGKGRLS